MRIRLGLAALLVVLVLGMALPVAAQDGEGQPEEDDQAALLERANAALESLSALDNVAFDYEAVETFEIAILSSNVDTAMTGVVLFGETPNVTAEMDVTEDATYAFGEEPQQEIYTLEADVLLVDGKVFVQAVGSVSVGGPEVVADVSEGWVPVEATGDYPALRALALDSLLAGDVTGWLLPLPFAPQTVFESPTQVTLEPALRDGETVDNIVITLERAGTTEDGEILNATTTITVTLEQDDDTLLGYAITDSLTLTAPGAVEPDVTASADITVIFTDHNAEGVEPAAVPEELAG